MQSRALGPNNELWVWLGEGVTWSGKFSVHGEGFCILDSIMVNSEVPFQQFMIDSSRCHTQESGGLVRNFGADSGPLV